MKNANMHNKKNEAISKECDLSPVSIDTISDLTADFLEGTKMRTADVLRLRLSVEEVMGIWAKHLGEDTKCLYEFEKHFGRYQIVVKVEGKKVNPKEYHDECIGVSDYPNILSALGVMAEYRYEDGFNLLRISKAPNDNGKLIPIIFALVLAVGLGFLLKSFCPDVGVAISEKAITPLFTIFMNLLRTIAGPLIFLAVCTGICGIGDADSFGKIGLKMVFRFVSMTFVLTIVAFFVSIWFFPVTNTGFQLNGSAIDGITQLIVSFVPTDIVSPFANGNAMQIIVLAIAFGVGMLVLSRVVLSLNKMVGEVYSVIEYLMHEFSKAIPAFIFICVLNIIIGKKENTDMSNLLKQFLLTVGVMFLIVLCYLFINCIRYKISFKKVLMDIFPTVLISITTASSLAAFSSTVECCVKKLKIPKRIVEFGIPVGQVLFMPGASVTFIICALCFGETSGVAMNPLWLIVAILVSGFLGVATPPIPGGSIACYTILFAQLGIPAEYLGLAISMEMILDYFATAMNNICLQQELLICYKKLKLNNN